MPISFQRWMVCLIICAFTMGCGEDEEGGIEAPPVDNPAMGKNFGENWRFVTGYSGGPDTDTDEHFFIILSDRPIHGCQGWHEIDETYYVVTLRAPRAVGAHQGVLGFTERNPEGAHPTVVTEDPANPAFIIVDEITDDHIIGEIDGFADPENFVSGRFSAVICHD